MTIKNKIKENHSIDEVYNLLLLIKEELKEFKLSASDLNLRMETIEQDLLYLKQNTLPDFVNQIIVEIDEIKDRIDIDFNYQNANNKKIFNKFSNENKESINKFGKDLIENVTNPLDSINESLNNINYRITEILAILKK